MVLDGVSLTGVTKKTRGECTSRSVCTYVQADFALHSRLSKPLVANFWSRVKEYNVHRYRTYFRQFLPRTQPRFAHYSPETLTFLLSSSCLNDPHDSPEMYRGYLFFSVKDRNLFHRVDTISNILLVSQPRVKILPMVLPR